MRQSALFPIGFLITSEYNHYVGMSRKFNKKEEKNNMTSSEVLQVAQDSLLAFLKMGMPLMLTALVVGLVISFFQALTQIQEMTLSFIPKIVAIFAVMFLLLPFMGTTMTLFAQSIFDRIVGIS